MAESPAAQEHRGVKDRGVPPRDQTIDPRQAAQAEATRLKALAPSTYRRPDGSVPQEQDFETFSRRYEQMANERHVWRFARPDGSTYETSWRGLGTRDKAEASASLHGHRVIGEVVRGPILEGTPTRETGTSRREPPLTPPPLVQAERPYSPPPLVQAGRPFTPPPLVPADQPYTPPPLIPAELPFEPLPWPLRDRVDGDKRGIENKLGPPPRRIKERRGASLKDGGTWGARLLEPEPDEIIVPPPSVGLLADPDIDGALGEEFREKLKLREKLLGMKRLDFAVWAATVLAPTVTNFLINLHLKTNDESELKAAGIIVPGQSKVDRGSVLENGSQKNAFRHAFGMTMITREFGREFAVNEGHAHEKLNLDTTRRFFSNPAAPGNALFEADTVADQLNNEIGRQIAERLGAQASNRDFAEAVLSEFRDKGLYVATFDMPGVVKLSRQRLAQKEFNQIMALLQGLNENGRSIAAEKERERERERERRDRWEMKR